MRFARFVLLQLCLVAGVVALLTWQYLAGELAHQVELELELEQIRR